MRYRRSVLIAVLASVLLASSLFAQTNTVSRGLDTMVKVPALVDASLLLHGILKSVQEVLEESVGKDNLSPNELSRFKLPYSGINGYNLPGQSLNAFRRSE